jgi:hypothetical protein
MSNPLINRWGLNTFWYNLWFTDYNFKNFYNQDKIFSQLLNVYLFNGLNLPYNIFANQYWYSKLFYRTTAPSYYKWITRKGSQFGELVRYSLRLETECLFPMKLWILRYNNWIILNQYWFYPLKKKLSSFRGLSSLNSSHKDAFNLVNSGRSLNITRLKTLITVNFLKLPSFNYYYRF